MATYESLLTVVQDLPRSLTHDDRVIVWCEPGSPVGVSRTFYGHIEIFLEGSPLKAMFRRVRDALEYQEWFRGDGSTINANRILLPSAGHFEQVAAFLCTELLRNGANTNLTDAFFKSEPVIELAISELLMAERTFVGLCGEMLVLQSLLSAARSDQVDTVLDSWKGNGETARDFQLLRLGVEVKTTVGLASSHLFSGIHQTEVGHGIDGVEEWYFFVASIGIEWVGEEGLSNSTSLPEIVRNIVSTISSPRSELSDRVKADFLGRLRDYGSQNRLGYDHPTMSESPRYMRRFRPTFARGYDMADRAIHLLSTEDLKARPFIDPRSISLRVDLPNQVTGHLNPTVGLSAICRKFVRLID